MAKRRTATIKIVQSCVSDEDYLSETFGPPIDIEYMIEHPNFNPKPGVEVIPSGDDLHAENQRLLEVKQPGWHIVVTEPTMGQQMVVADSGGSEAEKGIELCKLCVRSVNGTAFRSDIHGVEFFEALGCQGQSIMMNLFGKLINGDTGGLLAATQNFRIGKS